MRFRFFLIVAICLLAGPLVLAAQDNDAWQKLFSRETFVSTAKNYLQYRMLTPQSMTDGAKYPLVLFLHGAGERGSDNQAQLVHGMREFSSESHRTKYPAYVVAPQCPGGKRWVDVDWGAKKLTAPTNPSEELRMCRELIDQLTGKFPIDADRIYVVGLSMGGYGTFDAVMRWPDLFAAAAPICGGADTSAEAIGKMKSVPFWIAHGADDKVVPVEQSRTVVEALKQAGAEPRYVELAGVGHNSWATTFADEAFFEWLFSQKRNAR